MPLQADECGTSYLILFQLITKAKPPAGGSNNIKIIYLVESIATVEHTFAVSILSPTSKRTKLLT